MKRLTRWAVPEGYVGGRPRDPNTAVVIRAEEVEDLLGQMETRIRETLEGLRTGKATSVSLYSRVNEMAAELGRMMREAQEAVTGEERT